ncbi:LBP_cg2779 family protein [Secundilactobacillus kimchicus]|uniref:Uncharacterized protein n=1 Tax=Secundilactobacillus kimchicus JCM 15530 TaxID=1302272 RepID=A0A0R1HQK2_9LACO|nr:LBP_cg2779 family protein [Secundilactobacillus kimchicus]KRK48764.1 hypothetical protein FC96_GL001083 [Secundilactobacillus kimchicus JCM 15530]MBT9672027.1 hypothetical protein [Secundilactobacillus kimchicus]
MEEEVSGIAEEIIQYQKKHEMTDGDLALNIHTTIEKLHDIKSMEYQPTPEEVAQLRKFIG